jgi:hypothetical protein
MGSFIAYRKAIFGNRVSRENENSRQQRNSAAGTPKSG